MYLYVEYIPTWLPGYLRLQLFVHSDYTFRFTTNTLIRSLRLHFQVNSDYKSMFTPTTVTSSLRPGNSWTIFLYYACWSFLIGENISIWMTPFRFESSCARDGEMWWIILHRGDHIWSFFRRGAGIFLPWVILRRKRHHDNIWIFEHSNFWDVSSGVGLCPIMGNGCVYDLIWERHSFLGCIKLITLYYSSFISYILWLSQAIT